MTTNSSSILLQSPHATITESHGFHTVHIRDAGPLNILNSAVISDLVEAVLWLGGQEQANVVVLRGDGDKAFIAGADVSEMATLDSQQARIFISGLARLCDALQNSPFATVARIPGWCLGGGMEVAMSCDMRLCSSSAMFGMPEVRVGMPSVIHAALLPRLIGKSRADWMLLSGDNIDARKAYEWGLVHELVETPDLLDDAILRLCRSMSTIDREVIRRQKKLMRGWEEQSLRDSVASSIEEFADFFSTGAPQKSLETFLAGLRRTKS